MNSTQEKRHFGLDLLRITAMFMIVLWHILGYGKVIVSATPFSLNWFFAIFLQQLCAVAVNCYALISGYVNYGKKFKVKNIISLWLQVLFYSFIISLIFFIFDKGSLSTKEFLFSLLPVSTSQYWYFSSYFLVFFSIPFLNLIIEKSNKKISLTFIAIFIFLITILNHYYDPFKFSDGFSPIWLMFLYLIGAFIKKYNFSFFKNKKPSIYLVLYFCISLLSLGINTLLKHIYNSDGIYIYTYIITLFSSLFLFMFFCYINLNGNKFISFLAKTSFGVYLITEHFLIRKTFIIDRFANTANINAFLMVLALIISSAIIYLVCTLIEYIRQLIFKLLKTQNLLNKVQTKIDSFYEKNIKE